MYLANLSVHLSHTGHRLLIQKMRVNVPKAKVTEFKRSKNKVRDKNCTHLARPWEFTAGISTIGYTVFVQHL